MEVAKKITKSGGVTLPRAVRQETGIQPGTPVDMTADEKGIHIRKHVPVCMGCGTVEDVREIPDMKGIRQLELCPACAERILEVMEK